MIKLTLKDLKCGEHQILQGLIPGKHINKGGMGIKKPKQRSHDVGCDCENCDGNGVHIHKDDHEVFIILQGSAKIEINGVPHPLKAGDVAICEPGEDHHLVSDPKDPCINIFLHTSDVPHKNQEVLN
jgi:mannose-6-phosphate isomerase-like protein (cupin superfamily)